MLQTDKLFAGSIPENYDRYMVPLTFESYAADIAQRAEALSPRALPPRFRPMSSRLWPRTGSLFKINVLRRRQIAVPANRVILLHGGRWRPPPWQICRFMA